jgi:glutamyl/glutaminyl-tRNA synthetase
MTEFFFTEPKYKGSLLQWKEMKSTETKKSLELSCSILCDIKDADFRTDKLKEVLMPVAEKMPSSDGKIDRGKLLWPLRVSLTGREKSPGPFEIAEILGKEETLERIKKAEKLVKK